MPKMDLKKDLSHLYRASAKQPAVVEVPELLFVMRDGTGAPDSEGSFGAAVQALYAAAYTLKFMFKLGPQGIDWGVMPLEGLWWSASGGFDVKQPEQWCWTAMVLQPEVVTADSFAQALDRIRAKKDPPDLSGLRLETFAEGLCAQVMHIGPYDQEAESITRLHAFIAEQGGAPCGKHHELYLGDPRRTAPEKLKTILRQPFRR